MLITNEILMAYVDGELDEAQSAEVRAEIAQSQDLQARERKFKETAKLAREAYDEVLREPMPSKIMDTFDASVHVLPGRPRMIVQGRRALALAASLGLAAGIGLALIGMNMGGSTQLAEVGTQGLAATSALARVLERAASGSKLRVGSSTVIEPTVSYPRKGGGWCREYQKTSDTTAEAGLACRGGDGVWRILALVPVVPAPSAGGTIVPSGKSTLLDDAAEALMGGNRLDVGQEKDTIAAGWPSKK